MSTVNWVKRGRNQFALGDCLILMPTMEPDSIDSIVTDPPYGLSFMGKEWDHGVPSVPFWTEALRVAKPGAHLLAFGGTRTYHRLTCAIEDAGWEIRDCIMYVYGSGFPKSHNFGCKCNGKSTTQHGVHPVPHADVSEAVDIAEGRWEVLQPSVSQSCASASGRQELTATEVWGEQPGMEGRGNTSQASGELCEREVRQVSAAIPSDGESGRVRDGAPTDCGGDARAMPDTGGVRASRESRPAGQSHREPVSVRDESGPQTSRGPRDASADLGRCDVCGGLIGWSGWGTALKPAYEPIIVARKPLVGTVARNVQEYGTGGLNIDACRVGTAIVSTHSRGKNGAFPKRPGETSAEESGRKQDQRAGLDHSEHIGRWPANLIHDGSDEVVELFPQTDSSRANGNPSNPVHQTIPDQLMSWGGIRETHDFRDTGSAARFFYTAKASRSERGEGNKHPTVKPLELMRYLVRLVTRKGGLVLDPFGGSGTTAKACEEEGMRCMLIEKEEEHFRTAIERTTGQLPLFGDDE